MVGVITSWDIFAHPISTIRCFGWGVFFRAVAPWHEKTFLSLLQDAGYFGAAASKVPTILERCIVLEQRAKRIYEILATAFSCSKAILCRSCVAGTVPCRLAKSVSGCFTSYRLEGEPL